MDENVAGMFGEFVVDNKIGERMSSDEELSVVTTESRLTGKLGKIMADGI